MKNKITRALTAAASVVFSHPVHAADYVLPPSFTVDRAAKCKVQLMTTPQHTTLYDTAEFEDLQCNRNLSIIACAYYPFVFDVDRPSLVIEDHKMTLQFRRKSGDYVTIDTDSSGQKRKALALTNSNNLFGTTGTSLDFGKVFSPLEQQFVSQWFRFGISGCWPASVRLGRSFNYG